MNSVVTVEIMIDRKRAPAYDPDIVYDGETAAFVRNVRLVCGGLFGLVPGLWISAYLGAPGGLRGVVLIVTASVLACAVLAWCYGDAFWHRASNAIRIWFGAGED
jgi:hypothetical protein